MTKGLIIVSLPPGIGPELASRIKLSSKGKVLRLGFNFVFKFSARTQANKPPRKGTKLLKLITLAHNHLEKVIALLP